MFWLYQPNYSGDTVTQCGDIVYFDALLDEEDSPTELYNHLRLNFTPRIKGKLGNTLSKLKYTGNFIKRRYVPPYTETFTGPQTFEYFTIGINDTNGIINWHTGFLEDSRNADNKYFLLVNLWTDDPKSVGIVLTKPATDFYNYRFRNVEPQYNLDTTYQNNFTTRLYFPAGEGYLYQVAPVVKYGGKLAFNDTIKSNTTLSDDMSINNNVNLIINRGKYYTIQDTVTLVGTGFITGPGYLNIAQGGEIKIASWSKSVFKGRESINPKIIWGRYPTSGTVAKYRIFRAKGNNQFIQIAEVDSTKRQYIDLTTIISDRPEPNQTYADYYVRAVYQPSGNAPLSTSTNSNIIRYDIEDGISTDKLAMSNTEIINEYKLEQNYPNPFNPTTRITYSIKERQFVQLKIFDVLGRELFMLEDNYKEPGNYETEFDASSLASGVYIYRLSAGVFVDVKKMVVVK